MKAKRDCEKAAKPVGCVLAERQDGGKLRCDGDKPRCDGDKPRCDGGKLRREQTGGERVKR